MQYSLVNGERIEARPKLTGTCICCNKPTKSACGKVISWHWRHVNRQECDRWWESETEWHREWKSNFPEDRREVVHHDPYTDEKHIADVKTYSDVVLEFQNSPISVEELLSREAFYKRMIWVVNGKSFKENFEFGHKLPDPKSDFPKNFKFLGGHKVVAYDRIKYPNRNESKELLAMIDNVRVSEFVERFHTRHFSFIWKKPRHVWFQAKMPVFIDFNDGILWRLLFNNDLSDEPICCGYTKSKFIQKYNKIY